MIGHVEHGRSGLLMDGAVRAAEILDVSLDYLAGLTDDPRPAADRPSPPARPKPEKAETSEPVEKPPAWVEALLDDVLAAIERLNGPQRPAGDVLPFPESGDPDVCFVPKLEVQAAAGHGAIVHDETVTGAFAFRRDWLDQRGIDPAQASLVEVLGRSMEPELAEGSTVLVDHKRRRRLVGHVFVVRTADGVVVKRAGKDEDGRWLMLSDNEDQKTYPPVPWTREDRVIGEVRWVGTVVP